MWKIFSTSKQPLLRHIPFFPCSVKFKKVLPLAKFKEKGEKAILGREEDNVHYVIDSKRKPNMISRKHASIRFENGQWILEDERSTNGMFVNNKRVSRVELKDGDIVILGGGSGIPIGNYKEQKESEFIFRFELHGDPTENSSISSRLTTAVKSIASAKKKRTGNPLKAAAPTLAGTQDFGEGLEKTGLFSKNPLPSLNEANTQDFVEEPPDLEHCVTQEFSAANPIEEGGTQEFADAGVGAVNDGGGGAVVVRELVERVGNLENEVKFLKQIIMQFMKSQGVVDNNQFRTKAGIKRNRDGSNSSELTTDYKSDSSSNNSSVNNASKTRRKKSKISS